MPRKNKSRKVTLPISDTVPAPGNYSVEVLDFEGDRMPVVDATDLIDTNGAGTANDVASDLQAPVPGREKGSRG